MREVSSDEQQRLYQNRGPDPYRAGAAAAVHPSVDDNGRPWPCPGLLAGNGGGRLNQPAPVRRGFYMRTREMPNEPEDRTYAELVALLPGGRPAWTVGLSD